MKHPKLSQACGPRGAAMGRCNEVHDRTSQIKLRLYRMPMIDHDYDQGGAYWGAGSAKTGFMYHAYGAGEKFVNEVFVRARTREQAKTEVLQHLPKAKFYR